MLHHITVLHHIIVNFLYHSRFNDIILYDVILCYEISPPPTTLPPPTPLPPPLPPPGQAEPLPLPRPDGRRGPRRPGLARKFGHLHTYIHIYIHTDMRIYNMPTCMHPYVLLSEEPPVQKAPRILLRSSLRKLSQDIFLEPAEDPSSEGKDPRCAFEQHG